MMTKEMQDQTWKSLPPKIKEEAISRYDNLLTQFNSLTPESPGYVIRDLDAKLRLYRDFFGEHNLVSQEAPNSTRDKLGLVGKSIVYVPPSVLKAIGHNSVVPTKDIQEVKVQNLVVLDSIPSYYLSNGGIIPVYQVEEVFDKPYKGDTNNITGLYFTDVDKAVDRLLDYVFNRAGGLYTAKKIIENEITKLDSASEQLKKYYTIWKAKQ